MTKNYNCWPESKLQTVYASSTSGRVQNWARIYKTQLKEKLYMSLNTIGSF